jgi:two-component system chemotaxis response regulator CheY
VPSVLIVDDDSFIRKLVSTTLEDVADVDLVQAADGGQALDAARNEAPSIVFLDIDMPVLDGPEVCRRLRAEGSDATIVMLTAAARDEAERECERAGADLFLTKPFSPLELLRLVDDLGKTTTSR